MDPYALKRDNRKKFFDKEKLKRKHATPSDRKYRALNKSEEVPPPEPELQANDYRYHEDISMTYGQDDFDPQNVNKKLKEVLQSRGDQSEAGIKSTLPMTRKNLDSMTVAELNGLLQRNPGPSAGAESAQLSDSSAPKSADKPSAVKSSRKTSGTAKLQPSAVPTELESEQDFLDELI
ncbi:LAQU0S14e02212g1_1 [Lachancea quebecensis]|uniref:LAQU0S14e02212g1_1 n=1 Tax=Lachancea quebecensis TaxID=1654605 RepID=A0A0P1KW06_9SACH|nr:LAQU0S14e02212g1_1 [Lachancea quebecensis]